MVMEKSDWSRHGSKWRAKSMSALKALYAATVDAAENTSKDKETKRSCNLEQPVKDSGGSNGICLESKPKS